MFTCRWIFITVFLWALIGLSGGNHSITTTTCEEFETGARFDPYQIMDSRWRIIYFYGDNMDIRPIIFSLIDKKRLDKFQAVMDSVHPNLGVEWHKATFMMEPRPGVQVLMTYMETPGAFRGIVKVEQRNKARPNPEPLIKLADLRFKLEGRHMAMMCCEDMTAFVLARLDEVPYSEEECEKISLKFGLKGTGGKTHLYIRNLMKRTEL